MGGFQIDWRGPAALERGFPAGDADAPAVARFQAREAPLRHRSDEIVSVEDGEIEEFLGDLDTNRVQPDVVRPGAAVPVPIKSGERIATTALQVGAENIGRHGDMLPKEPRFPNGCGLEKNIPAVCKPPLLVEAISLRWRHRLRFSPSGFARRSLRAIIS